MSRLRILVLAPGCNPETVSIPFVTYSHAAALAELHDVTLVIATPTEEPVRRGRPPFAASKWFGCASERIWRWSFVGSSNSTMTPRH